MTDQKHNILEVRDLVVDFPIFGGIMQRRVNSVHAVRRVSFDLIKGETCLLYTSPSPRDATLSRMPSSA